MTVVVTVGDFQAQPLKKNQIFPSTSFHTSDIAPGIKLSVAEVNFIFGGGVIYTWHVLGTSKVLVIAISYIA